MYSFNRLVVHAGAERSIEPLSGNETSSLESEQLFPAHLCRYNVHDVDPRSVERIHTRRMVVPRVDRVHADSIDAELTEVGNVACAVG